jgi:hypothetical protein
LAPGKGRDSGSTTAPLLTGFQGDSGRSSD